MLACKMLRQAGWRAVVFITNSPDTARFETVVQNEPSLAAVLDYSFSDLAAHRLGLAPMLQPERLTAASMRGLPQVIVPGGLDHVVKHGSNLEVQLNRSSLQVNDTTLLYRTSSEDNDLFGKELAFKVSASNGPAIFVFPRGGLSSWDKEGEPLYDPQANRALLDSLLLWKKPGIELVESHRHINDPHFVQIVVEQLMKLLVVRDLDHQGRR